LSGEGGNGGWGGETSPYPEIYYITIHLWLAITPVRWQRCCSGQGVDNVCRRGLSGLKKCAEYDSEQQLEDHNILLYTSGYCGSLYIHMKTSGMSVFASV
jgi:hypothetical protein